MRLLDRYMVREFVGPFFTAISAFTIIILSGQLFWLAELIVIKKTPVLVVARLIVYSLPGIVVQALPLAVLFGCLLGMGRLVKDSELPTIRTAGVPFPRLIAPWIVIGLLVSAGGYYLGEKIAPWTNHQAQTLIRKVIIKEAFPTIEENVFFRAPGNRYFYIGRTDSATGIVENVMVYEVRSGAYPVLVIARQGYIEESSLVLRDGIMHELDRRGHVAVSVGFDTMSIEIAGALDGFVSSQKDTTEMSRQELRANILLFERSGIRVSGLVVDYHIKLAQPISALIFALLGSSLMIRAPRRGGSPLAVVVGSVLSLAYFILLSVFRSLAMQGTLNPLVAAWASNAVFLALGLALLSSVDSRRTRRFRLGSVISKALIIVCLISANASSSYQVTVKAQRVVFNGDTGLWQVQGGVVITFKDTVITGDLADIDLEARMAVVRGSVQVSSGEDRVFGAVVTYNLATNQVTFEDFRGRIKDARFEGYLYLMGEKFVRDGNDYKVASGSFTTCDLETPHFRIEASEMELYHNDRIVLKSVSYYEGRVKLLSLPRLVIPLKEDRKLELPRIGYGLQEGWYIKATYNYNLTDNAYGSLYADYFQFLGPALGIRHTMVFGEAAKSSAYAYRLWNRATGHQDTTLQLTHSQNLPMGLSLQGSYTYRDYLTTSAGLVEERVYDTKGSWKAGNFNTSFTWNRRDVLDLKDTTTVSATVRHTGSLPLDIKLNADMTYRFREIDAVQNLNVLNYRVLATRSGQGFRISALAQAQIHIEDDTEDPKPETPPPFKALERIPEITLDTDRIKIPGTPLTIATRALYGRYVEDAIRDGQRSTIEGNKVGVELTVALPATKLSKAMFIDASTKGFADLYDMSDPRWGWSLNGGVNLTPSPNGNIRLSYQYLDVYGASPFRFDGISEQSKLTATVSQTIGRARLTASSGYSFITDTYDNLSASAAVDIAKGMRLDITGRYDLNTMAPTSVAARLVLEPSAKMKLRTATDYSFTSSRFTRVESSADMWVNEDWRVQWAAVYDVARAGLVRGDIGITRDMHCREVSVMYQHTTKRVWVELRIKALPSLPLGFGLGEDGVLLGTKGPF